MNQFPIAYVHLYSINSENMVKVDLSIAPVMIVGHWQMLQMLDTPYFLSFIYM